MAKPKITDLIKLSDVPKLIVELSGVTRVRSTIYGWVLRGRGDSHGSVIKLKTTRRLGALYTTKAWVLEFIELIG